MQRIIEQGGKYTYMEYIVVVIASSLMLRKHSRMEELRLQIKEELRTKNRKN
ncbi:hypothetical protein [Priestia taiwanensis]|uniref:Uncharacterized protein n=1 Tax=Priestia taiwanensis TaxID=1347902 RepID=A0A917EPA8_9BACI|nr:hypothetical protein [Priestia taiwanensis]MBM7363105.1 hypothetical protein [Priestia taiwanensis]GGE67732.1 hypothetical protein GCM10007140_17260 [Priestia taiwanensis]